MRVFLKSFNLVGLATGVALNFAALIAWSLIAARWPAYDALRGSVACAFIAAAFWLWVPFNPPPNLRRLGIIAVVLALWAATLCAIYPLLATGWRGVDLVGLVMLVIGVRWLPNPSGLIADHWRHRRRRV